MTIDELINQLRDLTYRTPAIADSDVYIVDGDNIAYELSRPVYDERECDVRIAMDRAL